MSDRLEEIQAEIKRLKEEIKDHELQKAHDKDLEIRGRLDALVEDGFPCPANGGTLIQGYTENVGEKGNRYTLRTGVILRWEHIEWLLDQVEEKEENP